MLKIGSIYIWTASDHWMFDVHGAYKRNLKHNELFMLVSHKENNKIVGPLHLIDNVCDILIENEIYTICVLTKDMNDFVKEVVC